MNPPGAVVNDGIHQLFASRSPTLLDRGHDALNRRHPAKQAARDRLNVAVIDIATRVQMDKVADRLDSELREKLRPPFRNRRQQPD